MTYKPKIQSKIYTNSIKNHIYLYENMDNSCKTSLKITNIQQKCLISPTKLHENYQKLQQNL